MLNLIDIKKTYEMGDSAVEALKGVSIEFRKSEFVSVLGPSGCGKTTMLNIIGGLDKYTDGDLVINGISTKDFNERDWDTYRNHSVGFVFQSYNLIPHLNVLENVELALTLVGVGADERRERAKKVVTGVGLREQSYKRPNQLSGGQMQRVAIARALINDPEIVLADEPTGALDSESSVQIMNILKDISKTRLVIMVTHNSELARAYSTRIVRLSDGCLVGDSNPYCSSLSAPSPIPTVDRSGKNVNISNANSGLDSANNSDGDQPAFSGSVLAVRFSNGNVLDDFSAITPEEIASAVKIYEQDVEERKLFVLCGDFGKIVFERTADNRHMLKNAVTIKKKSITGKELAEVEKQFGIIRKSGSKQALNEEKYVKKPSMSFFTALGLSYKNLTTKKLRTFLTAFAGSIGILGVALVLALSNGLNGYISRQEVALSSYPITIYSGSVNDTQSVVDSVMGMLGNSGGDKKKLDKIYRNKLITEILNSMSHKNVIDSSYIEKVKTIDPALYYDLYMNFGLRFNVFKKVDKGTSILGTKTQTDYYMNVNTRSWWSELPSRELVESQYDLVSGEYPTEYDQVLLVLDATNKITDINLFVNGLDVTAIDLDVTAKEDNWSKEYSDVVGQKYELLNNNSYYSNISGSYKANVTNSPKDTVINTINKLMSDNGLSSYKMSVFYDYGVEEGASNYNYNAFNTSTTLTISGIVRLKEDISVGVLSTNAIAYTPELTKFVMESAYRSDVVTSIVENSDATLDELSNTTRGYGFATIPNSIMIYAKDYSCKEEIKSYLDQLNDERGDGAKILYTDYMNIILSIVKQFVDIITYGLVALTAVSLLVSSLMIGIITYASVLERTREIGVLRAMGARRKDVSRVFNAEAILLGLIAGIIGVAITFLLSFPLNSVLLSYTGVKNLTNLAPLTALGLVLTSMALTFVAGLIPSTIAGKKDPVKALRAD